MKKEVKIRQPLAPFFPVPVVLISCIDTLTKKSNIITIGWIGIACSEPPMIACAIRPSRYSYDLINKTGDFVVNIPSRDMLNKVDNIGIISGRDHDKYAEMKLTPMPSKEVQSPMVQECPINLECKLRQRIPLGSHDLFIGEIVTCHVDSNILAVDSGKTDFGIVDTFVAMESEYWEIGRIIGEIYKQGMRF